MDMDIEQLQHWQNVSQYMFVSMDVKHTLNDVSALYSGFLWELMCIDTWFHITFLPPASYQLCECLVLMISKMIYRPLKFVICSRKLALLNSS